MISAATGIVLALLKLGRQIRMKGVWLSPRDYSILASLYHARPNGLTTSDLLALMNRRAHDWTLEEISQRLKSLEDTPRSDGTKAALVHGFPDGRWRAAGV
jgi:hypothetical protein